MRHERLFPSPLFALAACGAPAPSLDVVRKFHDAAMSKDAVEAERCLAGAGADVPDLLDLLDLLDRTTRAGTLRSAEVVSSKPWAEHGVVFEVRKMYADGTSQTVRLDVNRVAGKWRIEAQEGGL